MEEYKSFGKEYDNEKAIVSLTSWKGRINVVSKTIFALIKNCKDYHIVLVLSEEEFPKRERELPNNLLLFVDNKLIELMWCNKNIYPHKKYYFTMKKYRDVPIILVDDDLIYNDGFCDKLYDEYLKHKNSIICSRCHYIMFNKNEIMPYKQWKWAVSKYSKSKRLFLTSGAGTLFPPNILDISENNLKEIEECLYADDVYLNVLAIRKNIEKIHIIGNKYVEFLASDLKENTALWNKNQRGRNDAYIKHFKNDFLKLKNEK